MKGSFAPSPSLPYAHACYLVIPTPKKTRFSTSSFAVPWLTWGFISFHFPSPITPVSCLLERTLCHSLSPLLFHRCYSPLANTYVLLSGSNLSQGQRQLVSLARALLAPSNILVLDEATAAVDVETDALLQTTLRSPLFSKRTIITIAHRINTILDSDRIVVLEQGKVMEFDTPKNLMDKQGLFWKLVKEAGLVDSVK